MSTEHLFAALVGGSIIITLLAVAYDEIRRRHRSPH
jgi:hypothetical protein